MPLVDIDYGAVIVASLCSFALGVLWFSPLLFGGIWNRFQGGGSASLEGEWPGGSRPGTARRDGAGRLAFVAFACCLATAILLAVLLSLTGFGTAGLGALLGFLCWLGFAATLGLAGTVLARRPLAGWLVESGYGLLALVLMGAVLGGWQ